MLCRAPRAIIIINGNPSQTLVIITAMNVCKGEVSHSTGDIDKYLTNIRLIAPYSKLNIPLHVRATIYCGTAQGKINKVLKIAEPGSFRLRRRASETPIVTWKNILTAVQIIVFRKIL